MKETEREDRRPQAEGDRDGGKEMQETACFLKVFVHSRRLGVVFDSFDSFPGTPPANSRRTMQFFRRPHGL